MEITNSKKTMALHGIRIVDFTHVFQGPLATLMLADFGADVIKVERPDSGDWSRNYGPYIGDITLPYSALNRNKRSIVLNLKNETGLKAFKRIIKSTDVMVHNFRPGVTKRLGIDYDALSKINPRLVYAYSSGWGDKGPYVDARLGGQAQTAAAAAGLFRTPEGLDIPIQPGISMDYPAGLTLCTGILLALYAREQTGIGQEVSTDLYSSTLCVDLWNSATKLNPQYKADEKQKAEEDQGVFLRLMPYAWRTSDGLIEVSPTFVANPLREICLALDLPDFSVDERFSDAASMKSNAKELIELLKTGFLSKTSDECLKALTERRLPCIKIRSFEEAMEDPQTKANEMLIEMNDDKVGKLKLLANPIRARMTPASYRQFPQGRGVNTEEILRELNFTEDEIAKVIECNAIGE